MRPTVAQFILGKYAVYKAKRASRKERQTSGNGDKQQSLQNDGLLSPPNPEQFNDSSEPQQASQSQSGSSESNEKPKAESGSDSSKSGKPDKNDINDGENKELAKLKEVAGESESVLVRASSVFPFVLFPDTITIDRHKLNIFYKRFFGVGQTVSVPLENVKNIQADIGPLFGSVTITSDHFVNNTQEITYLPKKDAQKIQRVVQGSMVAIREGIDTTEIEAKDLLKYLSKLGQGDPSKGPAAT